MQLGASQQQQQEGAPHLPRDLDIFSLSTAGGRHLSTAQQSTAQRSGAPCHHPAGTVRNPSPISRAAGAPALQAPREAIIAEHGHQGSSAPFTKPLCTQKRTKSRPAGMHSRSAGLAEACVWASSFSWCGNTRSLQASARCSPAGGAGVSSRASLCAAACPAQPWQGVRARRACTGSTRTRHTTGALLALHCGRHGWPSPAQL